MAAQQDAWLELTANIGPAPVGDPDAWMELTSNVGIDLAEQPTGAHADVYANTGFSAEEMDEEPQGAYFEIHLNTGLEQPPVMSVDRPQVGWGVPCVPSYTSLFFLDDTKAYADVVAEVIA